MNSGTRDFVVPLLVALLGAGLLGYAKSGVLHLWRRLSATPASIEARQIAEELDNADKSSLLLVRENTALAARNLELYQAASESDARFRAAQAEWDRERARMRAEIDSLEAKLRQLLDELMALKTRHGMESP